MQWMKVAISVSFEDLRRVVRREVASEDFYWERHSGTNAAKWFSLRDLLLLFRDHKIVLILTEYQFRSLSERYLYKPSWTEKCNDKVLRRHLGLWPPFAVRLLPQNILSAFKTRDPARWESIIVNDENPRDHCTYDKSLESSWSDADYANTIGPKGH